MRTTRLCRFAERIGVVQADALLPRGMGMGANFLIYNCISHSNPTVEIPLFEIGESVPIFFVDIPIIIYKSV